MGISRLSCSLERTSFSPTLKSIPPTYVAMWSSRRSSTVFQIDIHFIIHPATWMIDRRLTYLLGRDACALHNSLPITYYNAISCQNLCNLTLHTCCHRISRFREGQIRFHLHAVFNWQLWLYLHPSPSGAWMQTVCSSVGSGFTECDCFGQFMHDWEYFICIYCGSSE